MNIVFDKYVNLITNLIDDGIDDLDSLKMSPCFKEFVFATTDVARYIINNKSYYVEIICKKDHKTYYDVLSDVTLLFLSKYGSQVRAIRKAKGKGKKHNYNAYLSKIFTNNYVCDSSKKKALKETKTYVDENGKKHTKTTVKKVKDADGKEHKVYASHVSMSQPDSEDREIPMGDKLPARPLPLDLCLFVREFDFDYNQRLVDDIKKLADHRYISMIYVYIADALEIHGYANNLDKSVSIFKRSDLTDEQKVKLFLKAYHKDLLEFVSHLDNKVISPETHEFFLSLCTKDINRFGRNFKLTNKKIHHLRGDYKEYLDFEKRRLL